MTKPKHRITTYSPAEVQLLTATQPEWIIENLIPTESLVDISAPPKEGKTTYMLRMARSIVEGTDFMGLHVRKLKVLYMTEQSAMTFRRQLADAGLSKQGAELQILFWRDVSRLPWKEAVEAVGRLCTACGIQIVFVDTFPQFSGLVGEQENNAGAVLEALRPLQIERDKRHLSFHTGRHDRKGGGSTVDAGRGSSAYAGAMDVLYSLRKEKGRESERGKNSRALCSAGRYDSIPEELHINLEPSGYSAQITNGTTWAHSQATDMLEMALKEANGIGLTIEELEARTKVGRSELQRIISELGETVMRSGEGQKGSPYRYRIAA